MIERLEWTIDSQDLTILHDFRDLGLDIKGPFDPFQSECHPTKVTAELTFSQMKLLALLAPVFISLAVSATNGNNFEVGVYPALILW